MTPRRSGGPVDSAAVETLLRDHLARRADGAQPSPAPVAAVTGLARRRERHQVLVAAVTVVALAAGGAAVARPWLDGTSRSLPAGPTSGPGPGGRWRVDEVPTRGDLAGSARWREAARDSVRRLGGELKTDVEIGSVVFAGHLPQGVLVLTALARAGQGPAASPTYLTLYSPTGRPGDLEVRVPAAPVVAPVRIPVAAPDLVSTSVTAPDGTGYVVIVPLVAATRVSVSSGPVVSRDGTVRRTWADAPLRDGVSIAALDRRVAIRIPLARLDGGRPRALAATVVNTRSEIDAFVAATADGWGRGPAPSEGVLHAVLDPLLQVVRVDRLTVEPVFHGREQPSTSDVVAANVRLDDGSVLQVAALDFDDVAGTGRTKAIEQLVGGRPVPAAKAATTPVAWFDDTSSPDVGALHARARLALPGAVRMEVRDVGAKPCAPARLLGSGPVDANGLGTVVVDVPASCSRPVGGETHAGDVYPTIVAVALDANGREIGRTPLQAEPGVGLVDTPEGYAALTP